MRWDVDSGLGPWVVLLGQAQVGVDLHPLFGFLPAALVGFFAELAFCFFLLLLASHHMLLDSFIRQLVCLFVSFRVHVRWQLTPFQFRSSVLQYIVQLLPQVHVLYWLPSFGFPTSPVPSFWP